MASNRPNGNGFRVVLATDSPFATKPLHLPPNEVKSARSLCKHLQQLDTDVHPQREERNINMRETEIIHLISGSPDLTDVIPKPLPGVLPEPRCRCDNLAGVAVRGVFLSGSRREGVAADKSDMDFMIELGPFQMQMLSTWTSGRRSSGHIILLKETNNPGFYQLYRAPRPACQHTPLPFGQAEATKIRNIISNAMAAHNAELKAGPRSGPAQEARGHFLLDNGHRQVDPKSDLVPCLRLDTEEVMKTDFARRSRPSGWPTSRLVNKLTKLPPYAVPVGFEGSENARLQWRISYSQHEYNVIINMRPEQRACLRLLKRCKAELKLPIKSYYLKTALMWVCENRKFDLWTWDNMYDNFLAVLSWMRNCIKVSRMPCYFDSRINLLATQLSKLTALRDAVDTMRTRLVPVVLKLFLTAGQISKNKWPTELLGFLKVGTNQLPEKKLLQLMEATATLAHGARAAPPAQRPPQKLEMRRKTETDRSHEQPPNTGNPSWRI